MHVKEFTVNSPDLPAELHGGLTPCLRPLPALSLPPTSTDHLPEHTARATRTLAGSPFTVTPVRTGNPDTALQAMAVVHAAAAARDRKVLWCTTSDEAADEAVENEVADTVTDIATARQRLTEHAWTTPAGTLLVVDHAVAAPPKVLADLAAQAEQSQASLLLPRPRREPLAAQLSARLQIWFEPRAEGPRGCPGCRRHPRCAHGVVRGAGGIPAIRTPGRQRT